MRRAIGSAWVLVAGLGGGCATQPATRLVPATDIGVAQLAVGGGGGCVVIRRGGLAAGTRLRLVAVPTPTTPTRSAGPAIAEAEILEALAPTSPLCPPELGEADDRRYRIRPLGRPVPTPAFAVLGSATPLALTPTAVTVRLEPAAEPATFRLCTSAEGVHLTLWQGPPLLGARLFHRYVPLGMDVEPSCVEADWAAT